MQVSLGSTVVDMDLERHPWFAAKLEAGTWEPATLAALEDLLAPGDRYIDIGGWIGPTALHAAAQGAHVHVYEPDPRALEELRGNLARNPRLRERVTIHPVALSVTDGEATLSSYELGDSRSSLVKSLDASTTVDTVDVMRAMQQPHFQSCAVMKMDVEGAEFILIPRMVPYLQKRRPALLLSTHIGWVRSSHRNRPKVVRGMFLCLHGLRQVRLLWSLRFYSRLQVDTGARWRTVSWWRAALLLLRPKNREFLLRG